MGTDGASENLVDARQGAIEIGTLSIELIDHDGARQVEFVGEAPNLFGLHLDPRHAIHHHQRRIGRSHAKLWCR